MPEPIDVARASDAVHAAHAAAAKSAIVHARAVADAQRALAATMRGEPAVAFPPEVTPLSDDDRAEIHTAARELGLPEHIAWTPEQHVAHLRRLPDSLAALIIERWMADSGAAWRCFEMGHQEHLDRLNADYQAAVLAHGCYEHTHPERKHLHG